jgi:hypothetical protein
MGMGRPIIEHFYDSTKKWKMNGGPENSKKCVTSSSSVSGACNQESKTRTQKKLSKTATKDLVGFEVLTIVCHLLVISAKLKVMNRRMVTMIVL